MRFLYLKKLLWLFGINLFISAFTFGGGYVVIPMIRRYFVLKKKLFSEEDLTEMAAIAGSSPGAIAVNLSSIAGYKAAGMPGAFISCIASILPALLILSILSAWYGAFADNTAIKAVLKGMELGVAAIILSLVTDMYRAMLSEKNILLSFLAPTVFIGNYFFNLPVAPLIIFSCTTCFILTWKHKKWRR